ncbi:17523_t:CDS:2, partial [Acaulospora colombiana]
NQSTISLLNVKELTTYFALALYRGISLFTATVCVQPVKGPKLSLPELARPLYSPTLPILAGEISTLPGSQHHQTFPTEPVGWRLAVDDVRATSWIDELTLPPLVKFFHLVERSGKYVKSITLVLIRDQTHREEMRKDENTFEYARHVPRGVYGRIRPLVFGLL